MLVLLQITTGLPDFVAHVLLPNAVLIARRHEPLHEPLGEHSARAVAPRVELPGAVAKHQRPEAGR